MYILGMCISITEADAIRISMHSQRYDTLKIYTLNKIINATLLFLPQFFMSWTLFPRKLIFSMNTKGIFLSNVLETMHRDTNDNLYPMHTF